ncbi:exodeoxyribonuclease III [Qipengyuania flava]|uniref:exodeoxyribonuclease III n=1 Tax=Qipengyuania flava TaxID=192812 RepID=UPI001C59B43A|nr:exodeoxyribonuclease III [Qipengyuania flava]MBW3166907.1 exodeoxyribonuclease III [Qipengyuania flava]MBY5964145.1 exodeoxyribonuclease III [Qipengyuania flava]MBY6010469.1 exodeoxyribonuclease III [Qipengyuania flava]MBY6024911.1 exodeoxyribonuclease III [Qipengyuania flava]
MRIASFNINGIKARLPRLKEWLEETRPTVACLQEIKTMDEGFPADEFESIGYKAIWHGQKSFNGVAILADGVEPVEIQRGLRIDGPKEGEGEQARYLEAEVNGVRICNLYLPNGNPHPGPKFDYKLAWMQRLRARMQTIWAEEVPAVVLGDFNVIPEDKDVWSVRAMASDALMQPESREAYRRMLADGWTDAIDTLNPRGGVWTYWDYQAGAWQRDHGFRIDHLLLSPELADRMQAAGVDKEYRGREKASDHTPVWVEISA